MEHLWVTRKGHIDLPKNHLTAILCVCVATSSQLFSLQSQWILPIGSRESCSVASPIRHFSAFFGTFIPDFWQPFRIEGLDFFKSFVGGWSGLVPASPLFFSSPPLQLPCFSTLEEGVRITEPRVCFGANLWAPELKVLGSLNRLCYWAKRFNANLLSPHSSFHTFRL